MGEAERQRYLDMEKERFKQLEEQRGRGGGASTNPFSATTTTQSIRGAPDLIDIFNVPPQVRNTVLGEINRLIIIYLQQQQQMDSSNPFSMGQSSANPFNSQSIYPQTVPGEDMHAYYGT